MGTRRKETVYSVLFVVSMFAFGIVAFALNFQFSKGGNPEDVENMLLRLHRVAALEEDLITDDALLRFGIDESSEDVVATSTGRTEQRLILLTDEEGRR